LVDSLGLLIKVVVHPANIPDNKGAKLVLAKIKTKHPRLEHLWVDGAYQGELIDWAKGELGITLEVVKRSVDQKGFVVLPRRWVVERSLAWYCRNRELSKDYCAKACYSASMVYLASIFLMAKRLAKVRSLAIAE
jgi:transposase